MYCKIDKLCANYFAICSEYEREVASSIVYLHVKTLNNNCELLALGTDPHIPSVPSAISIAVHDTSC